MPRLTHTARRQPHPPEPSSPARATRRGALAPRRPAPAPARGTRRPVLRRFAGLAFAALALCFAAAPAQAQTEVPIGWSLIPSGLGTGDTFRLLIVTSTRQNATATAISSYDTVVQGNVSGTGHMDIQSYSSNFKMLGCTSTVDATVHTSTRSTDTDAPIYWLNGAKVADNYADFYDGSWDSNVPKYPNGANAPASGVSSHTLVGCQPAGNKQGNLHLGTTLPVGGPFQVSLGFPGDNGLEISTIGSGKANIRRYYGLSGIFKVAAPTEISLDYIDISGGYRNVTTRVPGKDSYSTFVKKDVTSVIVTPTPKASDSGFTFEYLDENDRVLTDSNPGTVGYEMTLSEGRNTVKIRVTAEDGVTTRTYTMDIVRPYSAPVKDPNALMTSYLTATENTRYRGFYALDGGTSGWMSHRWVQKAEADGIGERIRIDALMSVDNSFTSGDGQRFRANTITVCFIPSAEIEAGLRLEIGGRAF